MSDRDPQTASITDLQRRAKDVLDRAARAPVRVMRPGKKPPITLVASDLWSEASSSRRRLSTFTSIVRYVVERRQKGDAAPYPAEFAWLRVFDVDDLEEFVDELSGAMHGALHGGRTWVGVDAVIDEWQRSAAVLDDDALTTRFAQVLEDIRQ
jgi:hypothetical protein